MAFITNEDADLDPLPLPDLLPPSYHQAVNYYSGLPSQPRLLGRTSTIPSPWAPICNDRFDRRNAIHARDLPRCVVTPLGGRHRALEKIEGILPTIMRVLGCLPWSCIDLVRIGSSKQELMDRPVVLWVGVTDARVPWVAVKLALRQVRLIFDSVGLSQVECEIRQAHVDLLDGVPPDDASPPVFAPAPGDPFEDEVAIKRGLSTALGQVLVAQNKSTEGTLGVYLRPKREPPYEGIWGLTCRHVCVPLADYANKGHYRKLDSDINVVPPVFSPSDSVLEAATRTAEHRLSQMTYRLGRFSEPLRRSRLFSQMNCPIGKVPDIVNALKGLEPWKARKIGIVFLAPAVAVKQEGSKPWLCDWGLLKLERQKFPSAYTKNEVDLRGDGLWRDERRALTGRIFNRFEYRHRDRLPWSGLLPIKAVVPLAELQWLVSSSSSSSATSATSATAEDNGPKPYWLRNKKPRAGGSMLVVGKRGAGTGLTWGVAAEFLSVIRNPEADSVPSRALTIIGALEDCNVPFSKAGDSGALVFDVKGRAVAMLTSGQNRGSETTYCTPLEVILDDIANEHGEEVELL